jgi:hypothetical protein
MKDHVSIGKKPSGGGPEPFNENNVIDWTGHILKIGCREECVFLHFTI